MCEAHPYGKLDPLSTNVESLFYKQCLREREEGGREVGREGEREGGREGGKEGGRE